MKKLLQLLNEYEESRWSIVAEDSEEYQAAPTWLESDGHVRHINANKVAYEKDTFDAFALSNKYGFIKWLTENGYIEFKDHRAYLVENEPKGHEYKVYLIHLAMSDDPIQELLSLLK
jgi:hypothetical protein